MKEYDENEIHVADLFCGAGGFSEGFRQKGFSLVYGIDYWNPAIKTSRYNHPGPQYDEVDILELDYEDLPELLLDVDVIIASPPCVSFSRSNKMGKADKEDGVQLIRKTLGIISWLKEHGALKYWVVENVPNAKKHIRDTYGWDELRLPGTGADLEVPMKEIYNSECFGVPQRRRRLFFGDFPEPVSSNSNEVITIKDVFSNLKNPLNDMDDLNTDYILDPCYPGLKVEKRKLTDHFYNTVVRKERWKRARDLKEDHGYMGRMPFPDEVDRPSRTVMATRAASSRESLLFGVDEDGDGEYERYRLPTIRELATFMSFPITYQFQGSSETEKYRLVGNAVPCKVSAAIAEAIAGALEIETPDGFTPLEQEGGLEVDLTGTNPTLRKLRNRTRSFSWHIDYLQERGFRIDIDNTESDFDNNEIIWKAVLHKGSGYKSRKETEYSKREIEDLKNSKVITNLNYSKGDIKPKLNQFEESLSSRFGEDLPSSERFLEIYVKREDGLGPRKVLTELKEVIDEHFPEETYEGIELENNGIINMNVEKIPVRIVAGMIGCKYVTENVDTERD